MRTACDLIDQGQSAAEHAAAMFPNVPASVLTTAGMLQQLRRERLQYVARAQAALKLIDDAIKRLEESNE